jgi:hypothetical protein
VTMAVRLEAAQGNGWLILLRGEPNVFVEETISMTAQSVEFKYGCTIKATIHVSSTEYRRFKRECGV